MLRIVLFLSLMLVPTAAKADYYVWKDPKSGLTISFPDVWKKASNQNPADVFTIIGPSGNNANPKCTVKILSDKRFVIFPPRYGRDINQVAHSRSFWEEYLGQYDDYTLYDIYDDGGLGRWHASYTLAGYTRMNGTVQERRRGIMFSSLYYDKMYTVECSAREHAYDDWHFKFMTIIKSIDFKKMYNEIPTGNYRDFLRDVDVYFWHQNSQNAVVGY